MTNVPIEPRIVRIQNAIVLLPIALKQWKRHGIRCMVGMSLNRLLSAVPFAHRLGSAVERRTTSSAFMIFFSLNLLSVIWGLMLVVSAVALFVIAWLASRVAFFASPDARDAEIHSIKSVTDIALLQHKAVLDVSESYATGATATFLCHLALGALLFTIIGSIAGLLLIRWMKRHLRTIDDDL